MTPIAPHITAFLQKRLAVERLASPHTCDTYAYAFQLLFEFMSKKLGVAPADIQLEQLDAPLVLEFLDHLQKERGNSARTRNARLASIRSFMRFNGRYVDIRVRGKGRRERKLTLWKSVGDVIRAWLAVRGEAQAPELFLNAWGTAMTRSGFERVLARHVAAAAGRCPSLHHKRVSPHVLRHCCALNTLQATRDLRQVSLWLGHASTQTTDIYLQADPTEKLKALAAMKSPMLRPGKFRPPDRLIAALRAPTVMRTNQAANP